MTTKFERPDVRSEPDRSEDRASLKCSCEAFDEMRGGRKRAPADLPPAETRNGAFPPPLELHDSKTRPGTANDAARRHDAEILFDKNSSPEQKLACIQKLSHAGIHELSARDENGKEQKLRLETKPVGSSGREMVHLFATDPTGRERPVLRGIANSSGNFERQRNEKGEFVDYYGGAKQQFERMSPNGEAPPRRDAPRQDDGRRVTPPGPGDRRVGPPLPEPGDRRVGPPLPERERVRPEVNPNPDVRRGPNSRHQAMEPVTDPSIVGDVGRRPSGQPVEPTYIGVENSASYRGSDGKKHVHRTEAWLDKPAAQSFLMMNEKLARVGKHIEIASEGSDGALNSAGRTHTQQKIATGIHAAPGNSVHEQGRGLDVRNFQDPDVKAALREFGFVQGNLSNPGVPIRGDAWHFSFDPRAEARIASQWAARDNRR